VVDTEIQIVGEGVLCICHGCIADLARTSRFDLTDRRDEIDQLQADLAKANAAVKRLEDTILTMGEAGKLIRKARTAAAKA
jgi:uncharacterized protein CbrC (UPF0167 family)